MQRRLTINISDEVDDALRAYASKNGMSVTGAIQKMMGEALFFQEQREKGNDVYILTHNNKLRKVVWPGGKRRLRLVKR